MTNAVQVASLFGRLTLQDEMTPALRNVQRETESFSQRLGNMGTRIASTGLALTGLTAPIMAFGASGIRTAGEFDAAMRTLSARTGITGSALNDMRDAAIQMGADTVFGATDAANSLLQLTSSGLSAQEALGVLPAVLNGAAASGENLANVADWTTDIMAAFGLSSENSEGVIDALTRAAGSGSASFGDLAAGFQNVGGMAAAFGLSVEDTAAILQTFSENGIKGAEAGTQLRSMLNNMTRPTTAVLDTWNALGLSMYDVDGNVRRLDDVFKDLNARLNDGSYSQEEYLDVIKTLGGSFGQLGLQALISSNGYDAMLTSMEGVADTSTIAEARMSGWGGALENLSGSIETLQITALQPLMDNVLSPLVLRLADVINKVTEWVTLNPELSGEIVKFLAGVVVLGPLLIGLGQIISIVGGAFNGLKMAMMALTGPIGTVIALGALLVTAYVTNFGGFKDFVDSTIVPAFKSLVGAIATVAGAIAGFVTDIPTLGLRKSFETHIIEPILGGLEELLLSSGAKFRETEKVVDGLRRAWLALGNGDIAGALSNLGEVITTAWNMIDFEGIRVSIVKAAGNLWSSIQEALFGGGEGKEGDKGGGLVGMIDGWVSAFVDWIPGAATELVNNLSTIITSITGWIFEQIPILAGKLIGWATAFVRWLDDADIATKLLEFVGKIGEWVLTTGVPAIAEIATTIALQFLEFVATMIVQVGPKLMEFLTAVSNWVLLEGVPAILNTASQLGTALIDGIKNGVNAAWTAAKDWIQDKVESLLDVMPGWMKDLLGIEGGGAVDAALEELQGRWNSEYNGNALLETEVGPPRAFGGPVSGGYPYWVGERGPELFVPGASGAIVPNHALNGGGTTIVLNANLYGNGANDLLDLIDRAARDRGYSIAGAG